MNPGVPPECPSRLIVQRASERASEREMEGRCSFFLCKKNRYCANSALKGSHFCGNHNPKTEERRVPCPIDPSHSVLQENLEAHMRKCPLHKQVEALKTQSFYMKGINSGEENEDGRISPFNSACCTSESADNVLPSECASLPRGGKSNNYLSKSSSRDSVITSDMKRAAIYKLRVPDFFALLDKIKSIHRAIYLHMEDSYVIPKACDRWLKKELNRDIPFQEKHVSQYASILGNMENFGLLGRPLESGSAETDLDDDSCEIKATMPAVVEFGAGRGYLAHMLSGCYNIKKVFLVERRSYKLKADRSLRKEQDVILERLRIDIEDLNLAAVESLKHVQYLAVGKHLCGPATDLTLRCCVPEQCPMKSVKFQAKCKLGGLTLATCCHHLCQWKSYINKRFLSSLGITRDEFHAISWFSSWAVDADHGCSLTDVADHGFHLHNIEKADLEGNDVEALLKNMKDIDRAVLGLQCKHIIDIGRCKWLQDRGLDAKLVKYVSSAVSPENLLLIAKHKEHT